MVIYTTELSDNNYKEFITTNQLVLVDIKAEWCGPCKQISPIVDELSNEFFGKLSVGKLDADKNQSTVSDLGVRNIPTLLLYKSGEIVEKSVGMTTKQKLTELIQKHL